MPKSKFVEINEKIAEKVPHAYNRIKETVVGGYAIIENTFIDKYLTKESKTVEEAKERLKITE